MDAQEGGWIVLQSKNSNKNNTGIYTGSVYLTYVQFSTTQAEFHYPQVIQTGSPGTFTTASFGRDHLQPYNHKFYSRLTCNLAN